MDIPPGVVEVHVLSGERYVIEQSATGDDEIRSHVLPEHTFRAAELFPTLPPE